MRDDVSIKSARLLLVDGDKKNNLLLLAALRDYGYKHVHITTESNKVESLCSEYDFDLIILEINMPVMDGFEVIKCLGEDENKVEIPIIVLTSLAGPEICNRVLQSRAVDFIKKSFNRTEVLNRIGKALQSRCLYKHVKTCNKKLEEKVKQRTQEIYDARIKVMRRLGRAAELRDNETGMHVMRMSRYSYLLAKAIGMSKDECDVILHASPLHDIGKIGIPDSILLKPGKLNKEEWEIMKGHALMGMEILEGGNCSLLNAAHTIAMTHHEKWNGSGYPNGLVGKNIPLMGRIVAVADVFDALTSERPYKKEWSFFDALNHLKREKEKHFDPYLVDTFVSLEPELINIRKKYSEESEPQCNNYKMLGVGRHNGFSAF